MKVVMPTRALFGEVEENLQLGSLEGVIKMLMPKIPTLTLIMMFTAAHSMRFDVTSGHTRCISEFIKEKSMTIGQFRLLLPSNPSSSPKISVRVTSPNGNNHPYGDHVDSGHFALSALQSGDYSACFWLSDHKPDAVVTVEFDWKTGIASKDWAKVAKKGKVDIMKFELEKLSDTITLIHDEMFFLREREEEMQQLNKATNMKMAAFSLVSIIICLSVAGIQFWHLKTFFEGKKLL